MSEVRAGRRVHIGVLALQGDFDAHARVLADLGARVAEVRRPAALEALDGLVIPGGESTTLLKLMSYESGWWEALERFHDRGGAFLATCAGLILLAREVRSPAQPSLGLIDVTVERNGYGRQRESFEGRARWADGRALEIVCIRAPRILSVGPSVEILATLGRESVLVSDGRVIGATFHPELTAEDRVHRLLVRRCREVRTVA